MRILNGPISDRLRKLFGADVKTWPAYRASESTPMPAKGVEGIDLSQSGRAGRGGRHRREWR